MKIALDIVQQMELQKLWGMQIFQGAWLEGGVKDMAVWQIELLMLGLGEVIVQLAEILGVEG
jgi:hypothetical protein